MTPVQAIIAKELRSYFVSPVVYVVGSVFLLIVGLLAYLYVVFAGMDEDQQHAVINVHRNPLVNWIWLGSVVVIMGTLIALIPSKPGLAAGPRTKQAARRPEETSAKETEQDEVPV